MSNSSENYLSLASQLRALLIKAMLFITLFILIIGTLSYQINAKEYFSTQQALLQQHLHLHQTELKTAWQNQRQQTDMRWLKPYLLPHSQLTILNQNQSPLSLKTPDFQAAEKPYRKITLLTSQLTLDSSHTLQIKQYAYFPVSYLQFISRPLMAITATALILWLVLGRWIHQIQQRLSTLSTNLDAYQSQPYAETEKALKTLIHTQPKDDLSHLSKTALTMLEQIQDHAEKLKHLALYDKLTGLPNRQLLEDRFRLAQADCQRNHTHVALILFDLDHFKQINDTLGHQIGDQVLQKVTQHIRQHLRKTDTLARWGGDEFIILLPQITSCQEVQDIIDKIYVSLQKASSLKTTEPTCTLSMGISCFPQDGKTLDELIHAADQALYQAKENGRNQYAFSKLI